MSLRAVLHADVDGALQADQFVPPSPDLRDAILRDSDTLTWTVDPDTGEITGEAAGGGGGLPDVLYFGDGADGACDFDGETTVAGFEPSTGVYTLDRAIYPTTMVVRAGVHVRMAGWPVICSTSLTIELVGDDFGRLHNDGYPAGSPAQNGAGSGAPAGHFAGGASGASGYSGHGFDGADISGASIVGFGGAGGDGGDGATDETYGVMTGGDGGTMTAAASVKARPVLLENFLAGCWNDDGTARRWAGGGGGGGGGGNNYFTLGGGGGGGGGGAFVAAPTIVNDGRISCNGGAGTNGGLHNDLGGQPDYTTAGGGGGGGGGWICVVTQSLTGNNPQANGGSGGANWDLGEDGDDGADGQVFLFVIAAGGGGGGGVSTTRTLTAGDGLTGGGDLSADRTFAVGAGTGITVGADDVAVDQGFSPTWTGDHVFERSDTGTNTPLDIITLRHLTSDTAAAGFGVGLLLQGEDDGGTTENLARLSGEWITATDAAEASSVSLWGRHAGGSLARYATLQHGILQLHDYTSGAAAALALRGSNAAAGAVQAALLEAIFDDDTAAAETTRLDLTFLDAGAPAQSLALLPGGIELGAGDNLDVSPAATGRLRFNSATGQLEMSEDGGAWTRIGAGGAGTGEAQRREVPIMAAPRYWRSAATLVLGQLSLRPDEHEITGTTVKIYWRTVLYVSRADVTCTVALYDLTDDAEIDSFDFNAAQVIGNTTPQSVLSSLLSLTTSATHIYEVRLTVGDVSLTSDFAAVDWSGFVIDNEY